MTSTPLTADGRAVELSLAATGLLAVFNAAGVLDLADVHVARRVSALCREPDQSVTLALALTVRALRGGSVCIDLLHVRDAIIDPEDGGDTDQLPWPEPDAWLAAVAASAMTSVVAESGEPGEPGAGDATAAQEPARPLVLRGSLLYLDRYHRQEEAVREAFVRRRSMPAPAVDIDALARGLDAVFSREGLGESEPNWQRIAAAVSVLSRVTVLAGGPGTGKTTTVAALLALLGGGQRIALAAPTGKAAARLEEAVRAAAAQLPSALRGGLDGLHASTVHRLLGWLPDSRTRFRHHRLNPLPFDVVVVDEMSMVSLTIMDRLVDALRPDTRLVLVGDPDQLTSVEAGAVMADITHADANSAPLAPDDPTLELLARVRADDRAAPVDPAGDPAFRAATRGVVELTHTWRFGGGISALADAVRHGDADRALAVLGADHPELTFTGSDPAPTATMLEAVDRAGVLIDAAARAGEVSAALAALERHRVLCAHRSGPYGVSQWSLLVEQRLREVIPGYGHGGEWYLGRPLLVTQNDRDTQLYNGDTGVMVATPDGPRAAFARGGEPALFAPVQLDAVTSVHAMTVHKAQGSQFEKVTFVLPPADSPLLTRELVYTAITRAREHVEILGTPEAFARAVTRPANRASGLRHRL